MRRLFQRGSGFCKGQMTSTLVRRGELLGSAQACQKSMNETHKNTEQRENLQLELKNLNKYMQFHKFENAISEIERLVKEKIELPISEILGHFTRNSASIELKNKLFGILEQATIRIPEVSYFDLIDTNLTSNHFHLANNIAIHAHLSGIILDVEVYESLFNSVSAQIDPTFLTQLYLQYRENFNLTPRIASILLSNQNNEDELLKLIEDDMLNQGLEAKSMVNRARVDLKNESSFDWMNIKTQQLGRQQSNLQGMLMNPTGKSKQTGFKNGIEYGGNREEMVGIDLLNFIKQGQKKGYYSAKEAPIIFYLKSPEFNSQEFDGNLGGISDESENGDDEYEEDSYIPLQEGESLHDFNNEEDESDDSE